MTTTLIDPQGVSDAGGVASRRGFRYQDHVGASFILEMLSDAGLIQVEFETGDDIVLRRSHGAMEQFEYVQVKTTEDDRKWSLKELLARDGSKEGTSLAERSLACDAHSGGSVCFRIVSQREVAKALRPFCVERDKRRTVEPELQVLFAKFTNKYKTFRSPSGRTLEDWAKSLYWQVEGSQAAVSNANINRLILEAENAGELPSYSQACAIYEKLMMMVATAADTSRVSDPDAKAVSRSTAQKWWQEQLLKLRTENRANLKVYRVSAEPFFAELHRIEEPGVLRSMQSYDVEFDEKVWRSNELVEYLLDWLPEIALPAKVLAEFSHLGARTLTHEAVAAFERHGSISDNQLIAELMLHAVLRHYFKSEPIACKVFHGAGSNRAVTSAHIVPDPSGDQLWIGRSRMTTADDHDTIIEAVFSEMDSGIGRDMLRAEKNVIVQLREPQHLRKNTIETVLGRHGKTEDLLRCLRLPILVAYDSEVIQRGFSTEYVEQLREEAIERYHDLKTRLPPSLREFQVHIFLIPVDTPASLVATFGNKLRGIHP